MLLYLDTRDLIALTDKISDLDREQFRTALGRVDGKLVYTLTNILETSAPLAHSGMNSNVEQRLNRLERMPHRYLAEARLELVEFQAAAAAFLENRPYAPPAPPFVPRFDYVISPFRPPITASVETYGLAQMLIDIWRAEPKTMSGYANQGAKLRAIVAADRSRPDYKRQGPNFKNKVARSLLQYGIEFPPGRIPDFANWIRKSGDRCPAVQLGYEVYHALLKNVGDIPEDSDMPDITHVTCVPYADLATLDARMRTYVARADKSLGTRFSERVCRDLVDVTTRILSAANADRNS